MLANPLPPDASEPKLIANDLHLAVESASFSISARFGAQTSLSLGLNAAYLVMVKHVETPVKVNAWVDRRIAPLVEALNDFPDIWTTSSCEGNGNSAHVHFAYRGPSNRFANFMREFSAQLRDRVPTDHEYKLSLEWVAGGTEPLGTLTARREVLESLAEAIRRIAVSFGHKNPYRRGTRGTRPRNSITNRRRRASRP